MTAATMFSGIGAPETACPWVDWRWSAEIDPAASLILSHRHPHIPNLGDVTDDTFLSRALALTPPGSLDLLAAGSPCQSFSVAGRRAGVDDPRGVLAFEFIRICAALRPRWFLFENVPGILSSAGGRDWAAWLEAASQCGYHVAHRVLDARYFGVPQRRRRVFAAGYLGDWRPSGAVLFEPHCLRRHPPPCPEKGEAVAGSLGRGTGERGWAPDTDRMTFVPILEAGKRCGVKADLRDGLGIGEPGDPMFTLQSGAQHAVAFDTTQITSRANCSNPQPGDPCHTLPAHGHPSALAFGGNNTSGPISHATAVRAKGGTGHGDFESETFIAHTLRGRGFDASEDGTGRGTPLVAFSSKDSGSDAGPLSPTLRAMPHDRSHPNGGGQVAVAGSMGVRRLTALEAERLQGFPDYYTAVPHRRRRIDAAELAYLLHHNLPVESTPRGPYTTILADGPRYRCLGNSMALPVIRWIVRRMAAWDSIVG